MTTYAPPPPATPTAPGAPPPPEKSSGCLKWGLIGCSVVVVLIAAFCAVLVIFVFGAMKRSPVFYMSPAQFDNLGAAFPNIAPTAPSTTRWSNESEI